MNYSHIIYATTNPLSTVIHKADDVASASIMTTFCAKVNHVVYSVCFNTS